MRTTRPDASNQSFMLPYYATASVDRPEPRIHTDRLESGFVGAPSRIPAALSSSECTTVAELAADRQAVSAGLIRPVEGYRQGIAKQLRHSHETAWLYRRVAGLLTIANQWYRYRIVAMDEPLLYCEYPVAGKFDWHVDCGEPPTGSRKISLSIQLSEGSEYGEGRLEFAPNGEMKNARAIGTALAFPSFAWHRITPVTWGVRRSLVAWAHGPTFS